MSSMTKLFPLLMAGLLVVGAMVKPANSTVTCSEEDSDSIIIVVNPPTIGVDDDASPTTPVPTTEAPTAEIPDRCLEDFNFTILYTDYIENFTTGEITAVNKTKVVQTKKCCEGYVPNDCVLPLCENLTCAEDPNAVCVVARKCEGRRFPLFINGDNGMISELCTQPQAAQEQLCGTDICPSSATCPASAPPNSRAICFANDCECNPGPVWYNRDGSRALC